MMRALLLDRPGPPSSLRLGEVPRPTPGVGEILVRVDAVGLNPVDCRIASGGHPAWTYPHIPGLDIDAVVDTVSPSSAAQGLSLLHHGGGLAAVAGRPSPDAVEPFGIAPGLHEIALGRRTRMVMPRIGPSRPACSPSCCGSSTKAPRALCRSGPSSGRTCLTPSTA